MITKRVSGTQTGQLMFWAAAALLSVPLIIRAYIGTLTRYASDDFCWPMIMSDYGFLGSQIHLYTESYGRWAASALLCLFSYAGSFTAPILPLTAILLCTAAITWFLYEISHRLVSSIVVAEIIVLAVLTTSPRVAVEPLYWQSALLTYLPPFIIGPLGGALAVRLKSAGIAGITACLACGFNEAICIMVLSGLIIAIACFGLSPRLGLSWGSDRSRWRYIFAALTGTLLSTALAVLSPGNAIRRGDANPIPDPSFLVDSLRQTGVLLSDIALSPAGILLFVIGMALAPYLPISRRIRPLWTAVIGVLLALSATAASCYGVQKLMARTAIIPTSSLAVIIFVLGLWAGSRIIPRNAVICLFCTALFVIAAGSKSLSLLPVMQTYEQSWEAQHQTLEEAGPDEHVTIKPADDPFRDAWPLRADPDWSINQCVAAYYGVASVQIAKDP